MIRRPPRSTLFPYTRSSDLDHQESTRRLGLMMRDIYVRNPTSFRLFCPDETSSNRLDRKSTRLNSSHVEISYAVFCLKKKKKKKISATYTMKLLQSAYNMRS